MKIEAYYLQEKVTTTIYVASFRFIVPTTSFFIENQNTKNVSYYY